ncbi:hypothetical protein [Roseisalinus antarcticus]|uniref:PH domain-containing protein n=1 Tax=Roseisalinus antarcticus TaxID=254357 RepID=A0A1Y5RND7_9RHOB|nr:hypothetical protein [Roseisalinus antarcticus]SLN21663.1 hypothetical protein ROA7023_00579 [Roseisalinus antarcticus]
MTGWPLEDGETLLWEGRPETGLSLRPIRHITDQIAIVWGVIGVAATIGMAALGSPGAGVMLPGTLAIIAVQLGLIAWVDASRRRRTTYAVTDRRALIRQGRRDICIWPLDATAVRLEPGPPDCVVLGRAPLRFRLPHGGWQTTWREHRLDLIEDGAAVADLVRAAARANADKRPEGWDWSTVAEPADNPRSDG